MRRFEREQSERRREIGLRSVNGMRKNGKHDARDQVLRFRIEECEASSAFGLFSLKNYTCLSLS